jgi:GT2 family glycosyltransferase
MAEGAVDWIYTDDDRLDDSGKRSDPNLKGSFSPELALADDYATRLAVVRRSAAEDVGGLQSEWREAQVYDLLLRIAARGGPIRHVAEIGCHRRGPSASALGPHHRAAAQRSLAGRGVPAQIEVARRSSPSVFDLQEIVWPRELLAHQHVTIVIPTRDRVDLLERSIESLRCTVDLSRVQVLIVDDHSREEATRNYLATLSGDPDLRCRVIRPAPADDRFNYAMLMNAGSREVDTDLLLHLNNDIEAISPGWVDQMAGWLTFSAIGVVGAKLLYPDGSIQHAGVVVSPSYGAPGHLFARLMGNDSGYLWLPHRVRNVSAVTGACLLTRTDLFRELGGFDEEHLPVQFNDTDYCLRAIGAGKRVVYEPSAVLVHRERASRGQEYDYRETLFFLEKYRDYMDPFTSPLLDVTSLYGPTPLVVSQ